MTLPLARNASALSCTVVVNARRSPAHQALRSVERVLATTPPGTQVHLFSERDVRLPVALGRRVRHVRGEMSDYLAHVAREVAQDRAVVLLPASWQLTAPSWFEEVTQRLEAHPRLTGVLGPEGRQLYAFPRGVRDVSGPQNTWSGLPGLNAGAGSAQTPKVHRTLSAVLIVKDEERVLAECLAAVAPFVDEVVVYDTGSSDRTVEIARGLATTVVEGFWDDDFGAARTRALGHATTDWILTLDADEVADGDPDGVRRVVDDTDADAITVSAISRTHENDSGGDITPGTRLYRREGASWSGALHEQVVLDGGRRPMRLQNADIPLVLRHSGYMATTMTEKNKRERNVEISRAAYEAAAQGSPERADLASHHGRSLAGAGRAEEALLVLNTLLETPAGAGNTVQAGRIAAPLLLARQEWELAERWCALVKRQGESEGTIALWRAAALMGRGDTHAARVLLEAINLGGPRPDLWGVAFDPNQAQSLLVELDLFDGDPDTAARRILGVLERTPETVDLAVLVRAMGATGATMRDLIDIAPEAFLDRALRDMTALDPRISLYWFSAHSAARPEDFRPIVAGNTVAARVGWVDALEWSMRAREAGLPGVCALRELGGRHDAPVVERVLAWAVLGHQCDELDAFDELRALGGQMPPEERAVVAAAVREVLPEVNTAGLWPATDESVQSAVTTGGPA